ncbi:MAG: hypothetical protein ACR2OE_14895 [Thermomicrobiales bacterium]
MPTTNITFDSETGQRVAIIRTDTRIVRVTEHVDGPATCALVPTNPRQRCIGITLPEPLNFNDTIAHLTNRHPANHVLAS